MGIHCRYPANYKGYYIQSTMSPLVTSLMLLMVMVINTKGAPNPDTDNYSYSYEEDPVPCYPNCPPSKGQRFKRSAAPNPDTDNYEYVYEDPVPCAPNCPNGQRFKRYNSDDLIWILVRGEREVQQRIPNQGPGCGQDLMDNVCLVTKEPIDIALMIWIWIWALLTVHSMITIGVMEGSKKRKNVKRKKAKIH